ncbi:hypothetical protein B0H17DRAFT_959032 [Mycena rosella]|uniref:Uncharacterized protein n=1 Tax=Mycena rosella TaxID=1033263 RepID=A0AAD7FXM7_MYCRO|nr:hypothetical protein B0H17DRAFT_959032 [Mycena rosella]
MAQDDDEDNESSNENGQSVATAPRVIVPNQNLVAVAKRYAERKRLRTDQVTEVEVFLNVGPSDPLLYAPELSSKDSASAREVKMFVNMFALENKIDKIVTAKAAYQVSPNLNKNIINYAPAVLLSSKVTEYKGQGVTNILLAILKKHRFDLPAGIENIPADWAKVIDVVKEALTQKRSKIKQKARHLKLSTIPFDTNIFDLTSAIVKGTKCSVNRSVYLKHPGAKYWDKVDDRLAKIRKQADGDANKVVKYVLMSITPILV